MDGDRALSLRLAEPSDAAWLGRAALAAGGGIYEHLLVDAARGFSPEIALAAAIAAGAGGLSWRNGIVVEATAPLGAAIAYPGKDFGLDPSIAAAATAAAKADLAPLFDAVPPADSFYLHAIWVDAAARGLGAGGLLLDGVMAFAAEEGFGRVSLHVWADNAPALALYRSRGFETLQEIDVPRRRLMPHDGGKLLMAANIQ